MLQRNSGDDGVRPTNQLTCTLQVTQDAWSTKNFLEFLFIFPYSVWNLLGEHPNILEYPERYIKKRSFFSSVLSWLRSIFHF
jgi:hypothetical protein